MAKHQTIHTVLVCLLWSILPCGMSAQSQNRNYVLTRVMQSADGSRHQESISYSDGLGRPVEQVAVKASPTGKDIVTLIEYEGLDREKRTWLPVIGNSDGSYLTPADFRSRATSCAFYGNDEYPYGENIYEASALRRMKEKYGPGLAWRYSNGAVRTEWLVNSAHGELSCMKYTMASDERSLKCDGVYPKGQLYITRSTDEDGHTVLVFTDMDGKNVLQRQVSEYRCADTYSIYDGYGNLRYVLPPAASAELCYSGQWDENTSGVIRDYGYVYRYDGHGRCIEKKLPGVEKMLFVYDILGNPVYTQDGVQRTRGEWSFQLYDSRRRPTVSGVVIHVGQPASPTVITSRYTGTGAVCGYETSLPEILNGNAAIRTVNYYDRYDYQTHLRPDEAEAVAYTIPSDWEGELAYRPKDPTATNGYLTGTKTSLLDDSGRYTVAAFYYDVRGRVVQARSTNHVGGYEELLTSYTFTGKEQQARHTHCRSGQGAVTEEQAYLYDGAERLVETLHRIVGFKGRLLQHNVYDEIGRLSQAIRGGILPEEHAYNVRSWPTKIKSPLFEENLYYNERHGGNRPLYNGNISAMDWKVVRQDTVNETNKLRGYNFTYDGLNRLTRADYTENGAVSNHYNTRYEYDLTGNILSLRRNGLHDGNTYDEIDNLTYTYNGNQVVKIDDTATDPTYKDCFTFRDGADKDTEYEYDGNGNLTKDLNRGICKIEYNCLNLPKRIDFQDGGHVLYTYDAGGRKLRTDYYINPLPEAVPQVSGGTGTAGDADLRHTWTEYCGNFIYENDTLRQTLIEGGYISYAYPQASNPTNQATDISQLTPTYHFYVRDHLGNNRLVMNENGTIEQVSHYYPFGGLMGESRDITSTQRYRYNGKELDRMHGLDWYDYGARYYDASIGRWMCVDPLAEKYHGISPYAYCANNPTNAFDPDGRVVVPVPVITGTIGGVLGFAGNLVSQAIDGDLDLLSKKTWKRAGAATIAGAVAGATCNVGGIFIASTAGDVADQSIKNDGDLSKTNLTQAAASGIVSIVGAGAAKVLAKGAAGRTVANQIGKQFKPKATDALTSYIKTGKTSSRLTREKIATTTGAVLGGMTEKVANITTNNYLLPKDQDFVKDVLLKPISYGSDKSWSKSQSTIKTPYRIGYNIENKQ